MRLEEETNFMFSHAKHFGGASTLQNPHTALCLINIFPPRLELICWSIHFIYFHCHLYVHLRVCVLAGRWKIVEFHLTEEERKSKGHDTVTTRGIWVLCQIGHEAGPRRTTNSSVLINNSTVARGGEAVIYPKKRKYNGITQM